MKYGFAMEMRGGAAAIRGREGKHIVCAAADGSGAAVAWAVDDTDGAPHEGVVMGVASNSTRATALTIRIDAPMRPTTSGGDERAPLGWSSPSYELGPTPGPHLGMSARYDLPSSLPPSLPPSVPPSVPPSHPASRVPSRPHSRLGYASPSRSGSRSHSAAAGSGSHP